MAETQTDLFEDDPRVGQLLDHLDCIPAAEMERQWPQMLVALMDVLEKELGRQTVPGDNRQQARKLVAALAHYMGGRSYYLPSGDRLMNALRDDQIYSRFDGRNVEQLRRAYGLGQTQIYTIIAQQRALHVRRAQPDLFSSH
ncbi:Mor transcription activator family protein [Serratia marcescens]|uniref:Mor transcription activator family protein n=1 Tax=Serratia marcescens TaxID=615 RepID=UPI001BD5B02F|nr:Mor transcription activator family protein [Serratia marcescens]